MPNTLILDIGNVICEWNPIKLASQVVSKPAEQQALLRATVQHSDWLQLDQGLLTLTDAVERASGRTSLPRDVIQDLYDQLGPSLRLLPESVAAMARARQQGIPMYILSNMQAHAWEYLRTHHDCFSWCHGIVVSCEAQMIKPDRAIYRHLCDTFSLTPEDCVFIDDMPENIQAAIEYGLYGVQLADCERGGLVIDEVVAKMMHG